MKVFSVLLIVLFASSASARVGSVQRVLEAVDGAIPDEYVVMLDEGFESRGLVNGLKNRLVNDLKNSGQAEILYDYTIIYGFAVRMNLNALQNALKNIEGAEIYPNDVATGSLVQFPTDSWGLDRVDQTIGGLDNLDNSYTYLRDGSNVDVYIIDSGMFIDHGDFGGRASFGPDYTGQGNQDDLTHGTHVAGTVGGARYGIAKKVNLISVKVLNAQNSGTIADIVDAIEWVVTQANAGSNRAVINMSIGTSRVNKAFNKAADNAVAAGVVVVVAGGNGSQDACRESPGSADDVITVGATAKDDTKASFSNFGSCIDIFAPGVDISSCYVWLGYYSIKSGTSMASPHVAGVAALLLEEDPTRTPAQIADRIRAYATYGVVAGAGNRSPNYMLYTGAIEGPPDPDPTSAPTSAPSAPTSDPTFAPSAPTSAPTDVPSTAPVVAPTSAPTSSCGIKFDPCNVNSDCCSDICNGGGNNRLCK